MIVSSYIKVQGLSLGRPGGNSAEALRLDPKANPAAAEILAEPPPDSGSEVLGNINMTLLLR